MASEIWAYLSGRPLLVWMGGLWLLSALALTIAALVIPPPKKASFTLDWRQRAGIAWGAGALLLVFVAGRFGLFAWIGGLVAYASLTAGVPAEVRRRMGDRITRREIERTELGLHALVTTVGVILLAFLLTRDMDAWRQGQAEIRGEASEIARFAGFSGFPVEIANARARILTAEKTIRPDRFDESYFDSPCERLAFAERNWLICKAPDGRVTGIMVVAKTLGGQGLDKAVAADSRLLLWVVTGRDQPDQAAELAKDVGSARGLKAKEIDGVQVTGGGVDYLAYRVMAWPTGQAAPDTGGVTTYTY